jgi:hypothetical protein
MKLLKFLKKLAQDAKILQTDAEIEQKEHVKMETFCVSLGKLIEEKSENEMQGSAPELNVTFEEIYELLNVVPPAHGCNVDKAMQILSSEQFCKLEQSAAKKKFCDLLVANNIPSQDIIKDAISRDKALDSYEEFACSKLGERSESREKKIAALKQQIDQCQTDIKQLKAAQVKDAESFQKWIIKKVEKENQLVQVVAMVTTGSLISVGQVSAATSKKNKED